MYKIKFNELVDLDLSKLDNSVKIKVLKKLQKISENPEIWKNLWNKLGLNLSWYKKTYVDNKKIRIVYKIIDDKIEILIIAIWKREDKKVYKKAFRRIR